MFLTFEFALLILISSSMHTNALHLGESGEKIAAAQTRLYAIGLYSGKIHGNFNFETRSAVKAFQKENGLDTSGEINGETLNALKLGTSYALCMSSKTELLARCIEQSGCTSYPEMLDKGIEILSKSNGFISAYSADFSLISHFKTEPSSQAFAAALQAIRLYG